MTCEITNIDKYVRQVFAIDLTSRKEFLKMLGAGAFILGTGWSLGSLGNLVNNQSSAQQLGVPRNLPLSGLANDSYSYLVFIDTYDNNLCKAKNGTTGRIDYVSIDSTPAATTATIQNVLNNLTAGRNAKETVKLKGNFTLTKVQIPSYTLLDLVNAFITQADATNDYLFVNSDTLNGNTGIDIVGGQIDGNKQNQTPDDLSYNVRNPLQFTKVTDSEIRNVVCINSNGTGIRFNTCSNVAATRNTIYYSYKDGVSCENGSGIFVLSNYFYNTGESFVSTMTSSDVFIDNNYGEISGTTGININGIRSKVTNNTIKSTATSAIVLGEQSPSRFDTTYSKIIGNVISECGGSGIQSIGFPSWNLIIANNLVQGPTTTKLSGDGIRLDGSLHSLIDSNVVWGWKRNGISIGGYKITQNQYQSSLSYKNKITNNICYDNGKDPFVQILYKNGITLSGDLGYNKSNFVQGNICYDQLGVSGTQSYGIYIKNTIDSIVIQNDLRGNAIAGYLDEADTNTNLITVLQGNL